ncbi:MAG: hypothetical protein IPF88_13155 [Candidatus Microthrix sp.]|nr:hypothetical protein [Candidatus Microthrix sp.]MBK6439511.1 hypothetical protein [Candidatus Microthrix sp.]
MNDGVSFDEATRTTMPTTPALASGEHRQYTASDYLDGAPADDLSVDFAEEPLDTAGYDARTEQLLRRVVDLIEAAPGLPMSASVRINKDEILELLDDGVARLPDELRAARWLLKERDEFLAKTRRDGEEIISDAKARVAHMVQRTEVVKAAEQHARKVTEDAEAEAQRMHREVEDYCDQKLASFENVLERITRAVGAGRQVVGHLPGRGAAGASGRGLAVGGTVLRPGRHGCRT